MENNLFRQCDGFPGSPRFKDYMEYRLRRAQKIMQNLVSEIKAKHTSYSFTLDFIVQFYLRILLARKYTVRVFQTFNMRRSPRKFRGTISFRFIFSSPDVSQGNQFKLCENIYTPATILVFVCFIYTRERLPLIINVDQKLFLQY